MHNVAANQDGTWQCSSQWEWVTGNTDVSGIGAWVVSVYFAAGRQTAGVNWSHGPPPHQDWLPYPHTYRAHWPVKTSSIFSLSSHSCFSIDTADGSLISQLLCAPIWSEYIWKQIIWLHRFLKMVKQASIGYRGGLLSSPTPCLPHQYNFPRKTKR